LGKFFKNNQVLQLSSSNYQLELPKLDLETFPLIDDFNLELYDTESDMDFHLWFISEQHGLLATFPYWDNVELMLTQTPYFIPIGRLNEH